MSSRQSMPSPVRGPRRAVALIAMALASACTREGGSGSTASGSGGQAVRPSDVRAAPARPSRFGLGQVATRAEIAAWDIDANPDGVGLPAGRGTHAEGAVIYAQKCAMCHGAAGEGLGTGAAAYPRLIGRDPRDGFPFGQDLSHVKTVGNYWPYATTLYDYINRAMPLTSPGSLSPDQVFSLTAYLLAENEIIGKNDQIDARTLPRVRMPARGRFVRDDRTGGRAFR